MADIEINEGSLLTFRLMSTRDKPTMKDDEGWVIAFTPGQGFQWSKYFNGSDTWISAITRREIHPTHWLRREQNE